MAGLFTSAKITKNIEEIAEMSMLEMHLVRTNVRLNLLCRK